MPIPPIRIEAFGGEIPATDVYLLPENAAGEAVNAWLFSGRIEPMHSLQPLHTMVNPNAKSFFRKPLAASSIDYMAASSWLEFENENVRVIRSPTAGQEEGGRFYWADGIQPKMMTGDMIDAGDTPLKLGVPAPSVAPGVSASGGASSTNKTVAYVYTWVTTHGEEGPPSPPTTITDKIDATYHITMTAPSPADTAQRNLSLVRIYRTIVSLQGVATFFFVAEQPITDLDYDDAASDGVVVNNEELRSISWSGPPADLQGLVTMPNGMVVGWRKNEVWFAEPYVPHAWPIQYVISVDATIVGLGVYNQNLIILTEGQPYAAIGIMPGAMALSKIQPLEPCTSMRSIVNTPNGVLYSSPNGLINITPAGAVNLTIKLITKDQWANLVNLDSLMGAIISQGYFAYSGNVSGVFQENAFQADTFQQESHFGSRAGVYISLNDQRLGLVRLDPSPSELDNIITDIYNGEVMELRDGIVYLVDLRKLSPEAPYRWRSKIFSLPYLQNLGAAKVYWSPAVNAGKTTFRMYTGDSEDMTLRFEQEMTKSGQMFRLPSGYKALYYQFEVQGYAVVQGIHCTQTAHELRAI